MTKKSDERAPADHFGAAVAAGFAQFIDAGRSRSDQAAERLRNEDGERQNDEEAGGLNG